MTATVFLAALTLAGSADDAAAALALAAAPHRHCYCDPADQNGVAVPCSCDPGKCECADGKPCPQAKPAAKPVYDCGCDPLVPGRDHCDCKPGQCRCGGAGPYGRGPCELAPDYKPAATPRPKPPCSAQCTCGCQDGKPCHCNDKPPTAVTTILPTPFYSAPPPPAGFGISPRYQGFGFGGGFRGVPGGACRGGG